MAEVKFPQRVKRGSCCVTIYSTPSNGCELYTLSYYDAEGRRVRPTFAEYEDAKARAEEIVEKMARGQMAALTLHGRELAIYERAVEYLRPAGIGLDVAVRAFVEASKLLNGASLIEVAKAFAAQQPTGVVHKRVSEVVDELLAAKKAKGRSTLYVTDLRLRLNRFAGAFACHIANVTSADIDKFLQSLNGGARTKNNFRLAIGTVFNFAKKRGYVPLSHRAILDVEKETEDEGEVEVFTVTEIRALLAHAKEDLIPAVAIGGFAGLRSEEIRRLDWADVDINECHIEVRAAISKTRVRRIVPMTPNLTKWLMPYARKSGRVCIFTNYSNQLAKLAKKAGVEWKKNGLRHSFISYRVAATENIHQTSLEAGNTPAVITRSYLKCVTKEQARRWFSVEPASTDGIVVTLTPSVTVPDVSVAPESDHQVRAASLTSEI